MAIGPHAWSPFIITPLQGAPYDPHSYLNSYNVVGHVENTALGSLAPPLTREALLAKIQAVQRQSLTDINAIREGWKEILDDIHQQALFLPLWGSRIPYVIRRRLDNFQVPNQAFTYPLTSVTVVSGPTTVTVAPGSGGALFDTVGPMTPHLYAPNQLFINDWLYEGLVSYGQDGAIVPALASDWTIEPTGAGQKYTFELREGVTFHDGSAWNCSVAKLNFDHIFSDVMIQRHGWFDAPSIMTSWWCNQAGDFVLETNTTYYPLLQELTYVRPVRFAAASAFEKGLASDADLHNSCTPGELGTGYEHLEKDVTCRGLIAPLGTGPFKYVSRKYLDDTKEVDASVTFARHEGYWGARPANGIETIVIKHYNSSDDVNAALESGELDMVLGTGPLTPTQLQDIQFLNSSKFDVVRSEPFQNVLLIMNGNRAPTNDVNVRKAVVHAIDKSEFIDSEFAGLEQPVNQLLPLSAPFCDVDLNPKWDYDFEKATLLNCGPGGGDSSLSEGAVAGIAVGAVLLVFLAALVGAMIIRERRGRPLFRPLDEPEDVEDKAGKVDEQ